MAARARQPRPGRGRQWDFGIQEPRAPSVTFVLGFVQHRTLCWSRAGREGRMHPSACAGLIPLDIPVGALLFRGAWGSVPRAGSPSTSPACPWARRQACRASAAMPPPNPMSVAWQRWPKPLLHGRVPASPRLWDASVACLSGLGSPGHEERMPRREARGLGSGCEPDWSEHLRWVCLCWCLLGTRPPQAPIHPSTHLPGLWATLSS